MILTVSDVSKAYDGKDILKAVSFQIERGEKAALVGINGAGKTTLLRIIMGLESHDAGESIFARGTRVGYLAQHQELTGRNTIYEQLLSVRSDLLTLYDRLRESEARMAGLSGGELEEEMARYAAMTETYEREGGYAYKSEVTGVLKGLGFSEEEFGKRIGELSGGQKTRVALGRLLLTAPDLILLDEPTNHLDVRSIEWLETWLRNYRGAVLIVSHDRFFLNRIAEKVIEIASGRGRVYRGNYDEFAKKKEAIRKAEYTAYLKSEQERRHQEAVIAKLREFNREKSIRRAESRQKMLDRMDAAEKPEAEPDPMRLIFRPARESGRDVLRVENLSKRFGDNELFENLSFDVRRGEHICLIGANGTGKSTILKILNGLLPPDSGEVIFGAGVETAYYDQEMQVLESRKTIFEEISDDYPSMTESEIRTRLAAFLFTGDDVFTQIGALSGGERARVALCKLMLSNANFLMLDEPTNHLDIMSREVLESALRSYEGTVLCVSHDRYFINRVSDRILDLTGHTLVNYLGNYDYYLEKRPDNERAAGLIPEETAGAGAAVSDEKAKWQSRKEEEAEKRRRANRLAKLEKEIEALEAEGRDIDGRFDDPEIQSDASALTELSEKRALVESRLEAAYEEWAALQE